MIRQSIHCWSGRMPINATKFIVTIFLCLVSSQGLADCVPALSEPPCTAHTLDASLQEPSIGLGVGNPIHLVTGNKHQTDTDLPAHPKYPGLFLIRHYNSLNPLQTTLGMAWAFSYDARIFQTDNKRWQVVLGNGQRFILPSQPQAGIIRPHADHLLWKWPNGQALTFTNDGYLHHIQWPSGTHITIERHPHNARHPYAIKKVTNHQNQALHFRYRSLENGQTALTVTTPLGTLRYVLDAAQRLIKVQHPRQASKTYRYEARWQNGHSHALTGMLIHHTKHPGQAQRIRSWAYDSHGRAILSVLGSPDAAKGRLEINYARTPTADETTGLTTIQDATGQRTNIYTRLTPHGYRITRVNGKGCHGCPTPGTVATYDAQGKLQTINNTHIKRNAQGTITKLAVNPSGWGPLKLHYNAHGQLTAWASEQTGWETLTHTVNGQTSKRRFANGDHITITYDAQQRPHQITETHGAQRIQTTLRWHGYRLHQISHPHETETRHYDTAGHVIQRTLSRPDQADIIDRFHYDKQRRLTTHHLAEGGILHYQWGALNQLLSIYWEDKNGQRHPVIRSTVNDAGYHYGNELQMITSSDAHYRTNRLTLTKNEQVFFTQALAFDRRNLLRYQHTTLALTPDAIKTFHWAFDYDNNHRLISLGSETSPPQAAPYQEWLAWHDDGRAGAQRRQNSTHRPTITYDASGLPQSINHRKLRYDAHRRLQHVEEAGHTLVRYTHNAFGQTIRRESKHQVTTYDYLDNQLTSERNNNGIRQRFIYAHQTPVGLIEYNDHTQEGRLFFIHSDLLGAPQLVTDSETRVVWAASYHPLGHATLLKETISLNLRRPGQVYDSATGWHDNLLRTYLPEWGHYAEPDPLGPLPYNQAYGYAVQQPHHFIDPLGLLLFAFDGTRQSIHTAGNVWKLSQLYHDGPSHYQSGPGNSLYVEWDALTAHNAHQIIENQWNWLLFELSQATPDDIIPIDIIGFSRGAALARQIGRAHV